jgi:hypothetical protein
MTGGRSLADMGFVLLDLTFRAEKAFKVRIPRGWHERLGIREEGGDATLAQYHAFLLELCREQGVEPPGDSWQLVVGVVQDASGAKREKLTSTTKLIRDIAPCG